MLTDYTQEMQKLGKTSQSERLAFDVQYNQYPMMGADLSAGSYSFAPQSIPATSLQGQIQSVNANTISTLNLIPQATNTSDIGTSTLKYANVFATNVVTGDLVFEETECYACGEPLELAQEVASVVINKTEKGTHVVPIHLRCKTSVY